MVNTKENLSTEITPRGLLKACEVARQLNISLSLTYRLMQKGEIPNIRIANCVRVHLSDLEEYIMKNRSSQVYR